jgi:hypothetical protein
MARKRGKRRAKSRAAPPGAARRPARNEELGAASKALLGRDEETRAVRQPREDASVQDPLNDWPED